MAINTGNGIKANEKPTSDNMSYVYAENDKKEFVRIQKDVLKMILGIPTKLSELNNDKGFVDKMVNDLENYYLKSETYTRDEIDNKLSLVPRFSVKVVSTLPTEDISETTVYLVPSGEDEYSLYTEYINVDGLWEILGTQKYAFSGNASDVIYDDSETNLGANNVQGAIGKLSATISDKATVENGIVKVWKSATEEGETDTLLYTIDLSSLNTSGGSGSGATTAQANSLWAIVQKTTLVEELTEEELNAFKTEWGIVTVVIPATGITLNKTTLSFTDSASQTLTATVEPSDTTDKVVWTSSAESVATVTNGVVKPISNGSAIITATCGSVKATCAVTVDIAEEEQVTLSSITATYTGGNVTVGTSVNDLTGITVTAHYSDGSTANVTGYALSGSIAEGENIITVSYGGKTTTFKVTGVAESGGGANEPVYQLAQATTFDGTNSIDTSVTLESVNASWSITADITDASRGVALGFNGAIAAQSIRVYNLGDGWGVYPMNNNNSVKFNTENNFKFVITHTKGENNVKVYNVQSDSLVEQVGNYDVNYLTKPTTTVKIGSGFNGTSDYFEGTINELEIYECVLTAEEIASYLGV